MCQTLHKETKISNGKPLHFYYNNFNKIDFTLAGTMSGNGTFSVEPMNIRMITYKDNVAIQNDYAEGDEWIGAGSKDFNFNTSHKTNTTHNYRIQIIYDDGKNILNPVLNSNLTGNTYVYEISENSSTEAIFYAYEN